MRSGAELVRGALSLVQGLGVTLRAMVARPVTVPYPRASATLPPGFRGWPVLVREPDGAVRCVACGACARACPSQCLRVDAAAERGSGGRRRPQAFLLDISRCSLCGTCADVCPAGALAYSRVRCAAARSRDAFLTDLLNMPEEAP